MAEPHRCATTAGAGALPGRVRSARWSVTTVFMVHALLFASWTAHIPQIKTDLQLSDADLGVALLGAPIGSIAAMLVTGWLLPRLGSRVMVQAALVGYCLAGIGVGVAGSLPSLFGVLAVWGVFQGALDVSMNTQAVTVERALGRPIMSGLHGGWSIGGFTGAALGAVVVATGTTLGAQLLVLGPLAGLLAGWRSRCLLPDDPAAGGADAATRPHRPWAVLRRPVVLVLGLTALASMLCEGAAADWSAVYLRDSLTATPAVAGLGYAAFSAAMLTLRLTGNRLLHRYPSHRLLPALAAVSTVGFATALLVGHPVAALLGFLSLGVGLACVVPTVFSAAGQLPGINHGTAIAAASALGWVGFVAGPPLIGHLAAATTLPAALALLPVLTLAIAVTTRTNSALRDPARR